MQSHLRTACLLLGVLLVGSPLALVASGGNPAGEQWLSTTTLYALRGASGAPAPIGGPGALATDTAVTTNSAAQNEPSVAVDPTNAQNVLAAWNDYSAAAGSTQVWDGVGTSTDGGHTWNSRLLAPDPKDGLLVLPVSNSVVGSAQRKALNEVTGDAGIPFQEGGDPIVAFNNLGIAFAGQILFTNDESQSLIAVQASPDHGTTFLPYALAANPGQGFTDKPFMRADPGSSWLYVCWTQFGSGFSTTEIDVVASSDPLGQVWSQPTRASAAGTLVQGCDIAVEPNGDLIVSWNVFNGCLSCGGEVYIAKSTDHGTTFGSPIAVAPIAPLDIPNAYFRYAHFPRIAADANSGALYLAWAEGYPGTVEIVKSTDGGATWSAKHAVNTAGSSQWMPSIAVGPAGKVVVGFYDRRDDPSNVVARYYLATSTDGGATFTAAPSGTSAISGINTTWWFMGDYTDLRIGSDGKAHAVYTVTPNGNQDIYTNP